MSWFLRRIAYLMLFFVGYRILLWMNFKIWPLTSGDFRGLFGDFFIACAASAVAACFPRRLQSAVSLVFAVVIVLSHIANFETILATGGSIQLAHLQFAVQGTMARGSIFRIGHFSILVWSLLCLVIVSRHEARAARHVQVAPSFRRVFMAWFLVVPLGWNVVNKNYSPATAHWRQFNLFVGNLHDFVLMTLPTARRKQVPIGSTESLRHSTIPSSSDLSGNSIAKRESARRPNILLIMGEGVSGARMPTSRSASEGFHHMRSMAWMAEKGMYVPNFVGLNRVTNNGQFSILCGMAPNMNVLSSKMDMYDAERDGRCLPQVLNEANYRTVYLQGAWLEFMNKMRFMKSAGFSQVMGANVFTTSEMGSPWGADDDALFHKAFEVVESLEGSSDEPWFLALLTVGTHHPFSGGRTHQSTFPQGTLEHAMSFLDEQIFNFLIQLNQRGVLNETLVVLTSDESAGIGNLELDAVYQNWLPLLLIGPGVPSGSENRGLFSTADLALSLSEFALGEDVAQASFDGRSIFRKYQTERKIVFGNDYFRVVGIFDGLESLVTCDHQLHACTKRKWDSSSFHSWHVENPVGTEHEYISRVLDRSQWYPE